MLNERREIKYFVFWVIKQAVYQQQCLLIEQLHYVQKMHRLQEISSKFES